MTANKLDFSSSGRQIGILDLGYESYGYEKNLFEKNGYKFEFFEGDSNDVKSKINFASGCIGLLVRNTKIDKSFLKAMNNLKAIVRYGIGYDNIDLSAASEKNIPVANVQGYATHSVSDHSIALMFSCLRGITLSVQKIKSDITKPPFNDVFELHDKILGIIGLGRIGSSLSEKVKNQFSRVLAYDPYIEGNAFQDAGAEECNFEDLLKKAHVISLHCNLTEETKHILDERSFSLMQNRPIIINTARGPVIDEVALKNALDKKIIHSAGLDVFEDEPLAENQDFFLEHPRVVTTGHYAWYSEYAAKELQQRAAQNLLAMLKGDKIEDQLNTVEIG